MQITRGEKEAADYGDLVPVAVLFIFSLGVNVFLFVFPLFAFRNNVPGGWLGVLFTGYFLARLKLAPFAGGLSDRCGSKRLVFYTALFSAVSCCSYFAFAAPATLFFIQFILGISSGIIKPVLLAQLARTIPDKRQGRVFGWSNSAANLVFFFGPALGGILYYYSQMGLIIAFLTVCILGAALLTYRFFPTDFPVSKAKEESAPKEQRRNSAPFSLLAAVFGRTLGISVLLVFFPVLLSQKLGGPDWLTGLLVALPGGISCLLLPFGGRLADIVRRDYLVLTGMVLSAASLLMIADVSRLESMIAAGILMGSGTALSLPSSMLQAADSPWGKGTSMGIFQMAASAGFLLGPTLGGIMVQWTASAAAGVSCAGIIGLLCCIPFILRSLKGWRRTVPAVSGVLILSAMGGLLCYQQIRPIKTGHKDTKTFARLAMGGVVHLRIEGADEKRAKQAASAAFAAISRLETDFSHRNMAGSVGKINLAAGKEAAEVSPETFNLLNRALTIGEKSAGVFDITIGAVTTLPLYYRHQAWEKKAPLVDYRKVVLDRKRKTVFLPEQGMAVDLGGLAKGCIVDAAAAAIKAAGVPKALIEADGDFFCYGDRIWRVGIQNPRSNNLLGVIEVKNAGVCGSGDYYQYDSLSGPEEPRKHHILDPAGLKSAHNSIAVTVIAPTAELADALATTLFIMGPEKGQVFLKRYKGCSALWVLPDQTIVTSSDFPPFIKN